MSAFEELGICPEIIRAIEEDGWNLPSAIQAEVIPAILTGRDVCAAAETGSGKTGAFGLPCVQIVHEALRNTGQIYPAGEGGGPGGGPPGGPPPSRLMPDVNNKDAQVLFTEDGKEVRSDNPARWQGVRCFPKIIGGRYQYEVRVLNSGLCRVGVSCEGSTLDLGTDSKSWGFGSTGKKSYNRRFDDYGRPFGEGDVIGCLIDRESENSITYSINGVVLPVAFGFGISKFESIQPHICGKGFHVQIEDENLVFPIKGFQPLAQIKVEHLSGPGRSLGGGPGGGPEGPSGSLSDGSRRTPSLLILEPTRDLATQTFECLKKYSKYLFSPPLRSLLCIGGAGERDLVLQLRKSVDIVVGTLSCVTQLSMKGDLNLSKLKFYVLDEADELLKNDDKSLILKIKLKAQRDQGEKFKVQMIFISATLYGSKIREQVNRLCKDPLWVDLKGRPRIPDTLHAVTLEVDPDMEIDQIIKSAHNPNVLSPIPVDFTDRVHTNYSGSDDKNSQKVKMIKPRLAIAVADKLNMTSCLIFCRTNLDCDNLEKYLKSLGGGFKGRAEKGKQSPYSCVVCAGQRDNRERQEALELFEEGSVRFLICTDVAARGIDIHGLPFLIMMNIPDEIDQWFHRIGRVGRADAMGLAVTLHSKVKEKVWFHANCKKRGAGCTNTNLINQGGCCIWYDEPELRRILGELLSNDEVQGEVEEDPRWPQKQVAQEPTPDPLFKMNPLTLEIPGLIDFEIDSKNSHVEIDFRRFKINSSAKDAASTLAQYGAQRQTLDSFQDQQVTLMATVEELQGLEKDLQLMFLKSLA